MSQRKVKDAKDLETNDLIYFKGHAKATYMSDGRNVEDAINSIDGGGEAPGLSDYATKTDLESKQDKNLYFTNVEASEWVSDSTYDGYVYRCDIPCSGVTADMYAEVVFNINESTSGEYAPICDTKTNIVSIWSSSNDSITIPTIIIEK